MQKKLEQMTLAKEKTEEMLKEKEEALRLREEELETRGYSLGKYVLKITCSAVPSNLREVPRHLSIDLIILLVTFICVRLPVWIYAKIVVILWLVIPIFDGAALQQLLFRVLGCQPQAVHNFVIQLALSMVASESIKIYNAITDGTVNLVDKFFEMNRQDALRALEIYKRPDLNFQLFVDSVCVCAVRLNSYRDSIIFMWWRRDGRSLVPSVLLFYMGFGAASRTSGRSCQLQPNMDVVPLGHRQTS
ncbi:hypothetical protein POM88_053978 [Heracleum sosnowskyi]|uniref:AP180 N-terminal homology (ANTH) domain-containing protein n=1 Tax=Heracleum sosnowskyi TaxID=360622 RepID=A0AAD8GP14_9APIA|nr:hypothetical protein POM88_053978 [Heracleum sosnowskyi]